MDDLPADPEFRLRYRIAYGEAARVAEIDRFDHVFGRDFAAQVGSRCEAIECEVARRMRPGADPELIKPEIEDAMENRKSQW
jgi:hypothetical protein